MPQFTPSSVHSATVTFANPKSAGFDYTASFCMGTTITEMARASFHLDAGQSKPIQFSVTMPATAGAYPVYISVSSGGKIVALYKATEDVIVAQLLAGVIGSGLIYYDGIPSGGWESIVSGYQIPVGKGVYIAPMWINQSSVDIVGHVTLSVIYPDSHKVNLTAVANQDKTAAPGNGWTVGFSPFQASQVGTYTLTAQLSAQSQILDTVTFTLVAQPVVPAVEIVKGYIRSEYPSVSEAYSGWIGFSPVGQELNLALFGGRVQAGVKLRNPTQFPLKYTCTIYNYHWIELPPPEYQAYVTDYLTLPSVEPVKFTGPAGQGNPPTGLPYSAYQYECDMFLPPGGELPPGKTGFVYTALFSQSRRWNNVYIQIQCGGKDLGRTLLFSGWYSY